MSQETVSYGCEGKEKEVWNLEGVLGHEGHKEILQILWIGTTRTEAWGDLPIFGICGLGALFRKPKEIEQERDAEGGGKTRIR